MTVILDAQKLTYVAVPKVACTSTKTMLFEVENGFAFQPFHANGRGFYIHDFYPSIKFGKLPKARIADHTRLAVVLEKLQTLGPKISPEVLTPAQRAAIEARYAADYETFGAWF